MSEKQIWRGDMAIKVARTPGPNGPGFERDLLIQALGYHSHQARLERDIVTDWGRRSYRWRIFVGDTCVALRTTTIREAS